MTGLLAFVQGIDWSSATLSFVILSGISTPWIMLRNLQLPYMLTRIVREENEWLEQHPNVYTGHFPPV